MGKRGGICAPHVMVTSISGVFLGEICLGTGSFQLYSCPETLINHIQPKSEGEGNLCSRVTNINFWGSCDLITGDPKKDFVVVG